MSMRRLPGLWLAAALCVSSLGAAGHDAPLADAVQRHDKQAVQARCRTGPAPNASMADRWAWAAGCHYARH